MGCTFITEEKKALRSRVREQAAEIPENLRRAQDKALFKAFLGLPAVKAAGTVMVFWGVGTEPETTGLISALLASGKKVALPRCLSGGGMEARLYRGGRLVRGAHGIPEPGEDCPPVEREAVDVVLVPALCYDRRGFRLGRGGGYYDRWLAGFRGASAGLCRGCLLQDALPLEAHDRPVQTVVTETGLIFPVSG